MIQTRVCESCGAVVSSDRCDLCGTPVRNAEVEEVSSVTTVSEEAETNHRPKREAPVQSKALTEKKVCPTCGAANKRDAKFCDQCGDQLEEIVQPVDPESPPAVTPASPKPLKAPSGDHEPKPRIGLYVAVAIAAVIALYLLSVLTGSPSSPPAPAQPPAPAATSSGGDLDSYLPADQALAGSLSETRAAVESETDPARRQALQEELVRSYAIAGRLDLAGREQEAMAADLNTADAWAMAGNLHFDWMEGQSGPERVKAAQRAARAYEKALELDENNLDVRTDLGVAYLNDPSSPMLAIQHTNMVLEADSNHVQANFNKGIMLAQIGRTEDAIRLFRKVTKLSPPGEPPHEQAQQVLDQLGAGGADGAG